MLKEIIQRSLYPDFIHGEEIDFRAAGKAVSDYRKASGDQVGVLELMAYFVECGTEFTLDLGDIDEHFYSNLESMFRKTLALLKKCDKKTVDRFLPRLEDIRDSADGIAWGYHDGLCHALNVAFRKKR